MQYGAHFAASFMTAPACVFCASVWRRVISRRRGSGRVRVRVELTMNELSLLLEGSELALRVRLSPEPYRPMLDGAPA